MFVIHYISSWNWMVRSTLVRWPTYSGFIQNKFSFRVIVYRQELIDVYALVWWGHCVGLCVRKVPSMFFYMWLYTNDTVTHLYDNSFNSSPPTQNGRNFANIFKCILMNEKCFVSIQILLMFGSKNQTHNLAALVRVMAWRRTGDKPSSEQRLT